MKDIPVFTTENGAASLILREIPYCGRAYIKMQSTLNPDALLNECISFCQACGANWIHAAGHPYLEKYPLITAVVEMRRSLEGMEQTDAALFPVLPETVGIWREIYNRRMSDVPNAAYMTPADEKTQLEIGDGYFIHRNGQLLGIGRASADTIDAIISEQPGAGKDVVLALCSALTADTVRLTVAAANPRAVRLYERLGFMKTRIISRWFRVFPEETTE